MTMCSLLSQGPATFTEDRVRKILNEVPYEIPSRAKQMKDNLLRSSYQPHYDPSPIPYIVRTTEYEFDEDWNLLSHDAAHRRSRASSMVRAYCEAFTDCHHHVANLDSHFSKIIEFNFKPPPESARIVRETCSLLERLPGVPPRLEETALEASDIDAGYFVEGVPKTWENLKVVRFVDSNVIRIAILIVIERRKSDHWKDRIVDYINHVGELFDAASEESTQLTPSQLVLLRHFLWTGWHRVVLLNFYYTLGSEALRTIMDHQTRGPVLAVGLNTSLRNSLQSKAMQDSWGPKARYMCSWAFELLRSDRAAVSQDLRAFHERYNAIFGHLPPRCMMPTWPTRAGKTPQQCSGESPTQCQRFRGMKIVDQSAHAAPCPGGCVRLYWNEASYRGVSGSRAVSTAATDGKSLISYCKASRDTMAISHVWSHGQGGRPELPEAKGTGMNVCLHNRYSHLAKSLGCDSYWMDTPCIPQDHRLRQEAIAEINNVFSKSKLVLVCDRDIMSIDVGDLTMQRKESILSALLVCDWNVRAWTYLESVKGRHNIHLLCKDDVALPLADIITDVYENGNISIVVLFLTAQHLLPPDTNRKKETSYSYMQIEDAAYHLSHRHASRPGDEVVIWSLLIRPKTEVKAMSKALDFWKSNITTPIPAGYLISSSPRIGYRDHGTKGFGWAPRRPDLPERRWWQRWQAEPFNFAFDGFNTNILLITKDGLAGEWVNRVFVAHPGWQKLLLEWYERRTSAEYQAFRRVASMIPWRYRWGAVLAPENTLGPVHASTDIRATSIDPMIYRGKADGALLAVVATNGNSKGELSNDIWLFDRPPVDPPIWYWIGIFEWPKAIPLPEFALSHFMIV